MCGQITCEASYRNDASAKQNTYKKGGIMYGTVNYFNRT